LTCNSSRNTLFHHYFLIIGYHIIQVNQGLRQAAFDNWFESFAYADAVGLEAFLYGSFAISLF